MHTFTETVTAYIKFRKGLCIQSKSVKKYTNSSPSCNKTIKAKIKSKDEVFRTKSSDAGLFHRTKDDLGHAFRDDKKTLRDCLKKKFASNNSRDI